MAGHYSKSKGCILVSIKLCNVEKGKGPKNEVRCFDSLLGHHHSLRLVREAKAQGRKQVEWLSLY